MKSLRVKSLFDKSISFLQIFCKVANLAPVFKASLKTMEEPQLRALIKEDLKLHPNSKISEMHTRMGDFNLNYLRRVIYKMYDEGEINRDGEKKNMVYFLGK